MVGRYANVSILDVDSHEELHELLPTLPLFPYLGVAGRRGLRDVPCADRYLPR